MKTFDDLVFEKHPIANSPILRYGNAKQAVMSFDNGYGVSVIFGTCFYSNGINTYEVAILFNGEISFDTEISDDVIGYITKEQVTEIMQKVQELK